MDATVSTSRRYNYFEGFQDVIVSHLRKCDLEEERVVMGQNYYRNVFTQIAYTSMSMYGIVHLFIAYHQLLELLELNRSRPITIIGLK